MSFQLRRVVTGHNANGRAIGSPRISSWAVQLQRYTALGGQGEYAGLV
jgi:hypothetical protein